MYRTCSIVPLFILKITVRTSAPLLHSCACNNQQEGLATQFGTCIEQNTNVDPNINQASLTTIKSSNIKRRCTTASTSNLTCSADEAHSIGHIAEASLSTKFKTTLVPGIGEARPT
jgi:hypothetical protein